ncbi:hypothetical protein ACP70R_023557 [Stipagrostis hirtigluma subsp. patula]
MAAKQSSSSCLSFLKDALLLPTRNPKLFGPVFLLVAIPTLLINITNVLFIQPLSEDILFDVNKIKNTDPSSSEYARLMEEMMKEVRELLVIAIVMSVTAVVFSFIKQIVALFAASTTYSGDRYSIAELISKVIMKGHRILGPLITMAMVSALEFACVLLLGILVQQLMRQFSTGVIFLFVFQTLAVLYLNVVFGVTVAVSVADTERRGVPALRQAWRLMTQVRRKEGCVLAVVIYLLGAAPSPLYMVAIGFAKKSMAAGLALLTVYTLLSGTVQIFYFDAAMVYYYQAMETKMAMMADDFDYVKVPTGEASV